jgi:hypothetical protein
MFTRLLEHARRAFDGLSRQLHGDISGEPRADPTVRKGFDEHEDVGGATAA